MGATATSPICQKSPPQTLLTLRHDEYERAVPEPSGPFSEASLRQRLNFKMRENKRPTDTDPDAAPVG